MEVVGMYKDIPGVEVGPNESQSQESYYPGKDQWTVDTGLRMLESFDLCQPDPSGQIAHMEKHLLNFSGFGGGHNQPAADLIKMNSSRFDNGQRWGPAETRYPSSHWSRSDSSSSESTDYALSPDMSRHRLSLYSEDQDSLGIPEIRSLSFETGGYNFAAQGTYLSHMDGYAASNMTMACTMKDIQPNWSHDSEADSVFGYQETDKLETAAPDQLAMTPVSFVRSPDQSSYTEEDQESEPAPDSDVDPAYNPKSKARSRRTVKSPTILKPRNTRDRISKPSTKAMPSPSKSKSKFKISPKSRKASNRRHPLGLPVRPFLCAFSAYGCTSRFSSKNEWKRHVSSQHLQLGFWRCDVGTCVPSSDSKPKPHKYNAATSAASKQQGYNDFNRKDLFTQHHRRMHAPWLSSSPRLPITPVTPSHSTSPAAKKARSAPSPAEFAFEASLESVRERCWMPLRGPPQRTSCIFCPDGRTFEGDSAWEERMEHVGRHYEAGERAGHELVEVRGDEGLEEWAVEEGLVVRAGEELVLKILRRGNTTGGTGGKRRAGRVQDKGGEEDAEGDVELE